MSEGRYRFGVAREPGELAQIRRLNYRTFVEEIPQHAPNAEGVLADGREDLSTFITARLGDRLVGMIAVSDRRPFSLDAKLTELDALLPPARGLCEIRLLAVEPEHRKGPVFHGLVSTLARHCLDRGWDVALISGTVRQLRLYRHLGFEPFGPRVGTPEAPYQPMYLTLAAFRERERVLLRRRSGNGDRPASYLPGPVEMDPAVLEAVAGPPVSHRAPAFRDLLDDVRSRLLRLTGAGGVHVLTGSGTTANDAVSARLAATGEPGVILSHGEFGERLVDHARRWGLQARVARRPWGDAFDRGAVDAALDAEPRSGWLWAAHCETSTGVLADLDMLRDVCGRRGVALCLDSVSAVGAVPVDLRGVALASAVSTKALAAVPGLALVFRDAPLAPALGPSPRSLDLALYDDADGVPFTLSSNLLAALAAALRRYQDPDPLFRAVAADGAWLRRALRDRGLEPLGDDAHASPAVTTVVVPDSVSAERVGERMEDAGFRLSYRSGYLLRRNWLQVCLMGPYRRDRLAALADALAAAVAAG